jgi:YD repeat-containing protein
MVEGTSQLYHLQLSTASSLGMLWDSRLSEWHGYKKDTVIDDGSGMKIYRSEARDTASSSWWPEEIDTFFFRDGRITQARVNYYADGEWDRSRSSFVYNDRGFISENTYEYWSPAMQSWVFESRRKLTYAFNGRGDLDTFRFQDWNPSDGVWGSLDSASGIISSYVYDASGAIVSRTDSTFGSRYISSKSTHYFKFRDFPLPVKSAPRSPNAPGRPVTVFSDGRIVLQSMGEEALCARLLTPSGRLVAGFPLREGLNLKTCKRMHGIKGFFLLRIMEEKHGNPVGDWRIFLP